MADSEQMKINNENIPKDNKFDILIVEVNNINMNDPNMNAPSASLNVTEIIRTNIDKSYWDKLYRNSGYKNSIIIGYWGRDLSQDKKSQLLNLEGKKIIIFGERVKNTSELTFLIYKYYPYTIKNSEIVSKVINPVSRIYETFSPIIFLVLLLFPLLKIAFYLAPPVKKGNVIEQFVKVLPYLLVLEFVLYLIYENSIPEEYNIRIDLMLIYPALFCSTIFSILLVHRQSKKEAITK